MNIAGIYSFNDGQKVVQAKYPSLLKEVMTAITSIDASTCLSKQSREKTMKGKMLYSPVALNHCFKDRLYKKGWEPVRVKCEYPTRYYMPGYTAKPMRNSAFREMDFVKKKLGVEIQLGKYSFMVYNVAAKMTIFRNMGYIDTGIEIVPVKSLAAGMSTGVSYFEQFVWDLEKRGVADIDVPVMILGIDV